MNKHKRKNKTMKSSNKDTGKLNLVGMSLEELEDSRFGLKHLVSAGSFEAKQHLEQVEDKIEELEEE